LHRPFRLWLYPLPALIALVGWVYLFVTTDVLKIGYGLLVIVLGAIAYLLFSRKTGRWPFVKVT
jgi:hypothetical protein